MKERKGFNFYKSYYDVVMELENDKDKLDFIMALLRKQFEDIEPELTGLSKFAYISQKHSIDAQVKGFQSKVGYEPPTEPPYLPPTQPPYVVPTEPPTYVAGDSVMTTEPPYLPPSVQEQEQEQEKEKEKEQLATSNELFNVLDYTIKPTPDIEDVLDNLLLKLSSNG